VLAQPACRTRCAPRLPWELIVLFMCRLILRLIHRREQSRRRNRKEEGVELILSGGQQADWTAMRCRSNGRALEWPQATWTSALELKDKTLTGSTT